MEHCPALQTRDRCKPSPAQAAQSTRQSPERSSSRAVHSLRGQTRLLWGETAVCSDSVPSLHPPQTASTCGICGRPAPGPAWHGQVIALVKDLALADGALGAGGGWSSPPRGAPRFSSAHWTEINLLHLQRVLITLWNILQTCRALVREMAFCSTKPPLAR